MKLKLSHDFMKNWYYHINMIFFYIFWVFLAFLEYTKVSINVVSEASLLVMISGLLLYVSSRSILYDLKLNLEF